MSVPRRKPPRPGQEALPELHCACATARRAARAVTHLYDRHMHGAGIEASQFALLSLLEKMPGSSQAVQGRWLAMDKTTLSRNFKLLKQQGWIEPSPGKDERERGFRLTRKGQQRLEAAKPLWKDAQQRLQSVLGPREWEAVFKAMRALTQAATAAQQVEA